MQSKSQRTNLSQIDTPITNKLEEMTSSLASIAESATLEDIHEKVNASVLEMKPITAEIREMEKKLSPILFQEKLIEEIEKSTFWQNSKRMVDSIRLSAGYIAEITIADGKLKYEKFEIRTSTTQHRHVTPMAIIERIIRNSLQTGAEADTILDSLAYKLDRVKINFSEADNDTIQGIFGYFKNPRFMNANGISLMIKLISHFHNEKSLLAFDDAYIAVPHIHAHYLIPDITADTHYHKGEGSFIRKLCEVIANLEATLVENSNEKSGNNKEVNMKALGYAIFAMFDYLPLPNGSIDLKRNPKKRNRYQGEEASRLHQVAASHLHYIFEAYPGLEDHKKEIFDIFLGYVSNGVTLKDLRNIYSCNKNEELLTFYGLEEYSISWLKENCTHTGFAGQYNKKSIDFLESLKTGVEENLVVYNPDYSIELHPEHQSPEGSLEEKINSSPDKEDETCKKIKVMLLSIKNSPDNFDAILFRFVSENHESYAPIRKIINYSLKEAYHENPVDAEISKTPLQEIKKTITDIRDQRRRKMKATFNLDKHTSSDSESGDPDYTTHSSDSSDGQPSSPSRFNKNRKEFSFASISGASSKNQQEKQKSVSIMNTGEPSGNLPGDKFKAEATGILLPSSALDRVASDNISTTTATSTTGTSQIEDISRKINLASSPESEKSSKEPSDKPKIDSSSPSVQSDKNDTDQSSNTREFRK